MLRHDDGRPFARGAVPIAIRPAGSEQTSLRIHVPVLVEGLQTEAMVDTGGVYLVLDPELATGLGLEPRDALESVRLLMRGSSCEGDLFRLSVAFAGIQDDAVEVEATAFIPRVAAGERWPLGTVLGFAGCLERLCFAVDPGANMFYFGDLS